MCIHLIHNYPNLFHTTLLSYTQWQQSNTHIDDSLVYHHKCHTLWQLTHTVRTDTHTAITIKHNELWYTFTQLLKLLHTRWHTKIHSQTPRISHLLWKTVTHSQTVSHTQTSQNIFFHMIEQTSRTFVLAWIELKLSNRHYLPTQPKYPYTKVDSEPV